MILLYHRLGIVAYYGIISSKRLSDPAVSALQALGAMVHGTSSRLRKAAVRALGGIKLRKRTEAVGLEYKVESPSKVCSGGGTSVSEEVYSEEACNSSGRCESGSHAHGTNAWEREKALLYFAAGLLFLGQWQRIMWALSNLSLSQLSTFAATACVTAAAWSYMAAHMKGWTVRIQEGWHQLVCLVKTIIASILKLPEVSANIKLALVELQEVDYTLKNIHAKVKFLPGHVDIDTCLQRYTKEVHVIREAEAEEQRHMK